MDNIHAPTVPSGPTTVSAPNGDLAHLTFADLQRKKDDMEAELKALGAVLDSHGADMNTPLTTGDGFPRADIDVAQGRKSRDQRTLGSYDAYCLADLQQFAQQELASYISETITEA
ncbi:26S proteasome non-ATPase regulatory subunit 9 [Colletotrichum sidae]|uniref:26S proteasome non-ATPase regulatory subunit 9 n=1 Tax=Colletotrichum sidae TaxID=1347389 RepID=A0A4R8T0M8_9PEZI|nr:26S proteasome non-ATPase regulatory subunit 9 [Colletotrichum sidae]